SSKNRIHPRCPQLSLTIGNQRRAVLARSPNTARRLTVCSSLHEAFQPEIESSSLITTTGVLIWSGPLLSPVPRPSWTVVSRGSRRFAHQVRSRTLSVLSH